jgi:hypothetical protein
VAYLVGPSLVTATSSLAGPQAGSVLAGVVVLTGGVLLVRQRRTAPGPSHRAARSWAAVPRSRGLARSGLGLLLVANFGLGFAFGSLQVSVTAFAVARGVGEWAGVLYGIISVASLGAGFAYGHAKWRPRPGHLAVTLTLLATSCLVLTALTPRLRWLPTSCCQGSRSPRA